jgi:hypothetical protein
MAATPCEIEQVLEQMREVLLRWHTEDTLGEVAIVRGYHQYQLEERPRRKHDAVKRGEGGGKAIVKT